MRTFRPSLVSVVDSELQGCGGVADVGAQRDAASGAGRLQDGEGVAHGLAGVPVGLILPLYDRHRGPRGQLVHGLVQLGTEIRWRRSTATACAPCRDALAAGQVDLAGAQVQGVAAQLAKPLSTTRVRVEAASNYMARCLPGRQDVSGCFCHTAELDGQL